MLAEYKKRTNIGVGLGIISQFVGRILISSEGPGALLGVLLVLGGAVSFVWGCWSYAVGKGYHGAWGFLGLLSIIGLIILACFPDKHK